MRKYQTAISAQRLRHLVSYDENTGAMTWLRKSSPMSHSIRIGSVVGSTNTQGYRQVTIDGHAYLVSRLAFLWMTGRWPLAEIDHRDLDTLNNRWKNLREASRGDQTANTRLRKDNTSGSKGVFKAGESRFRAVINKNGKCHHLGYFPTFSQATMARRKAEKSLHGEFARAA